MEQLHWNNQNQNGRIMIKGLQWNTHPGKSQFKKWNNCNGTVDGMEGLHWNNHNWHGTININWNNYNNRPTTVKMEQSQKLINVNYF